MTVFGAEPATRNRLLIAGIFWIGTMQFFIAQVVAQAFWPDYSMRDLDISFLGISACGPYLDALSGSTFAVCSPLHGLIGNAFIATGLLITVGTLLSLPAWPDLRRTRVGAWLVAIGGLGTIASGVWPLDVNSGLHSLGALVYFTLANIGLVVLGSAALRRSRGFGIATIATGAVSLAGFVLFASQTYLGLGRGTMERIAGYPSIIWFIVAGVLLIQAAQRSRCVPTEAGPGDSHEVPARRT
jgi:hypothetical membrane protein